MLILLLDTTRADRLPSYGYGRDLTPAIDRLATEGVRFTRFYSNSSWTLPAHASLFTGLYPMAHRATQETLALAAGPATLAELFTESGYATFASSSNSIVNRGSGLARGFEEFIEVFRRRIRPDYTQGNRHPNNVALERFLADGRGGRPFFAFLNYIEAHQPYRPVEPFRSRWLRAGRDAAEVEATIHLAMKQRFLPPTSLDGRQLAILSDLYDGEIAYLDEQIEDVVRLLESRSLLDETLVILTSDHGEHLGEHGHLDHAFSVYNTLLHVPLIVRFPGAAGAGTVRTEVAQTLDLFPTIVRYCELRAEVPDEGRDLFAPGAAEVRRPALSEYYYPRQVLSVFEAEELEHNGHRLLPFMRRLRAIQDDRFKLIWDSAGNRALYDLVEDPGEARPLGADDVSRAREAALMNQLEELLEQHQGVPPLPPAPPPGWMIPGFEAVTDDPELLDHLRALGYVG